MSVKVSIEDYVAPEKTPRAPHEYAPIVAQLVEAGPDKVAAVEFATEEEAVKFLKDMQTAAREAGYSATKRFLNVTDKGNYRIGVNVREKISRPRKDKTADAPAEAPAE
jgi:hypothetical protein